MNESLSFILWRQFGGALEMLENALLACPEDVWGEDITWGAFWYLAYHTLFWTDFYFSEKTEKAFQPPAPFSKDEFDPEGVLPERVYTKTELLNYLAHVRIQNRALIASLTPERAQERFVGEHKDFSLLELTLYNLRHVQHHTAQLNLLLRQQTDDAPKWVSWSKEELEG
jgi:hypothetical protein